MKKPTPRERDLIERLARAERYEQGTREEIGRYAAALEGLMRAVLLFVASEPNRPTSIQSAKLISAVEIASRTLVRRS